MNDLKNKNIIVTGATGGIGNSIIKKLDELGANILASGTKIEELEEIKKELKWYPKTSFENGLNKTFDWYLNNVDYYSSFKKKDILKRLGLNKS